MNNWLITTFEDGRVHLFGNFISFAGGGPLFIRFFGKTLMVRVQFVGEIKKKEQDGSN